MKYKIGNYVRKRSPYNLILENDTYIVRYTKQDENVHPLLKEDGDYLIQKDWDYETKSVVKKKS